jgi:multiple sugar transport system substrate-binding protein
MFDTAGFNRGNQGGKVKKSLAFLSIVLLLFSNSACTSKKDAKTELRFVFWGDLSEIQIINNIVSEFERENPKIRVKLERSPSGAPYIEKLLTQFAGGMAPDVVFVEVNNFVNFAQRNVLMNLSEFIFSDDSFKLENYYPEVLSRFSVDNKLFVIPRDTAPICCIYYNKDLFDEAGVPYPKDEWQWPRDFLQIAQKLTKTDASGRITRFGFVDDWSLWDAFVLSNGGNYVDDIKNPTRITLDSPEALAGFQFRQDLIYKYKVMPSPSQMSSTGGVGSADLFMTGKAAMFLSGIWKTPYFRDIKNFDWDVVPFPKGPTGIRRYSTGGSGYAITKTCKNPREAWKLVKYLCGREGQVQLAKTGLAQPANMEIAKSEYFLDGQKPKNKGMLLEAVKYVTYSPYMDRWNEFLIAYLNPALDKVWAGEKTPEEVLKEVVAKANKELFKK